MKKYLEVANRWQELQSVEICCLDVVAGGGWWWQTVTLFPAPVWSVGSGKHPSLKKAGTGVGSRDPSEDKEVNPGTEQSRKK